MTKEELIERLNSINKEIEEHVKKHNDFVVERDSWINQSMAHHNMLIGQRNEIQEWLKKVQSEETPEPIND